MNKNIVIIHYNTPHLTECLVRSINLFMKDAVIYIFDNSDKEPFTKKFDNVIMFDNTKGQFIDFEEWLKKYPDKNKSNGKVNNWASAKHCYSVEKCIELVNEPFVLLDSDVLIKKDFSNLYMDDVIYAGETIVQPNSSINRILPFICYINVKKCKINNIHYFDENYMHGLHKTQISDRYDTGAGFYANANRFKHSDIKINEYITHFGHGSWNKRGVKKILSKEEWLKFNKKYWDNTKNRKVIYTCITGGYDKLIEPSYVTYGFDYICFTDDNTLTSDIWDVRPLPKQTDGLSTVKKQRYVKLNPHLLLSEYELSIWVDGNIEVKGDLDEFIIENIIGTNSAVYVPKHPARNCIYNEAVAVIGMKKDKPEIVNPQIERYKKEGFPKNYGLLQSNILVRLHNEPDCVKLMNTWFSELKNNSHRDQLSFNYACWKNKDIEVTYIDKNIYKSKWFSWKAIHKNNDKKIEKKKVITNGKLQERIVEIKKIINGGKKQNLPKNRLSLSDSINNTINTY